MEKDKLWMEKAVNLALKGRGYTGSNPIVGAVIVKEGECIGRGYHKNFGGDHAEIEALKDCRESPEGATMYVTLEPCCHFGKTPPCTLAIEKAKIKRVVVGCLDPNSLVRGKGVEYLKSRGIEVTLDVLKEKCSELNKEFLFSMSKKRPYILLKSATSLDGKIATSKGESKWITSEESRMDSHRYRAVYNGILVGIGTVLGDNPSLTNRSGVGENPNRIVLDSNLKVPLNANILNIKDNAKTIIFTSSLDIEKKKLLEAGGAEIVKVNRDEYGGLSIVEILKELYKRGIYKLLVEGGSKVHGSFLKSGFVDEVVYYIAPKLIGGKAARSSIEGIGIESLKDAMELEFSSVEKVGPDIKLVGRRKCLRD
ncbi:bifunctional diaminohydroxyphosphoribosylaminopyrimidine deaminase/5-amino-6-(5-phosphoribosylamino)uracil reductase RibD [Anaerosphaera multitolerans]|uniref:Riboflavin biosynthesis protein RibD n=1 Tax=Anaerosphaera multitolerans TaxID=2487351 RepID=A0A437S5V2_9FIRM|nr:bifunctional diaminohydroxyphosphoribosylaminopyrimidine deaminase/5-amino-6-(5-phosphoribosylamino)uracil reductase RibD [Anaerosphaera multitolerans]RVU54347.1 bifunctional diaminohydroxyphosphoribosylaminopyrimidine deaminase/5-amino-6-(5-phosphoribosylamino)uracil reductase RibD [Anaerosphaera multitolerans]